jgi:hypothetical protein
MDLLVFLREPARIEVVPRLPDSLVFDNRQAQGGFPPWPAGLDLLIDPSRSELIGVARLVPKQFWDVARKVISDLDKSIVRYVDLSLPTEKERYKIDPTQAQVLEIIWSPGQTIEYLPALLEDDCWYRTSSPSNVQHPEIVAFGIWHLNEVLSNFGLRMPSTFEKTKVSVAMPRRGTQKP